MRIPLAAIALLACNGATSSITVGGHALAPYSTVLLSEPSLTTVVITDVKNYCRELQASVPETPSCNAPAPEPYEPHGNFLTLRILYPDISLKHPVGELVQATFTSRGTGTLVDFVTLATEGDLDIEWYESGIRIAGNYKLTFPRDGEKTGTFDADECDARSFIEARRKSRQCVFAVPTTGVDACNRQCTCDIANVGTSCSFNSSANNWSCLCTARDFTTSTCVMYTRPDCSTDVGTCCNLEI